VAQNPQPTKFELVINVLHYVDASKNNLHGCTDGFWRIELRMQTIDAALERGQLSPDPALALAAKYGPPDEAA